MRRLKGPGYRSINAMGTHERMALALEVESLDDIAREITGFSAG